MGKSKEYVKTLVNLERKLEQANHNNDDLKKKYRELLKHARRQDDMTRAVGAIQSEKPHVHKIPHHKGDGTASEATAIVLASDWHVEEPVDPKTVSGLNRYSVDIARARADHFWQTVARMVEVFRKDIPIKRLIVALLGDFFSNDIHEELMESNQRLPMDAALLAQDLIASGITFLQEETDLNLTVVCHSGNHGRTTKKVHVSTERGHSLEYYMYENLRRYYAEQTRVSFVIANGYHSYVQVFPGYTVRFHHGHAIRYQGGIGGIFVPAFKAIAKWNQAKPVQLDCFGHFHMMKDGGNFVSNGSMIGYNAYALSIKADFETPRQAFMLVDHKRKERTITAPILFPV